LVAIQDIGAMNERMAEGSGDIDFIETVGGEFESQVLVFRRYALY
jgi:hypothetical protein